MREDGGNESHQKDRRNLQGEGGGNRGEGERDGEEEEEEEKEGGRRRGDLL
jgi:hypothetical protein